MAVPSTPAAASPNARSSSHLSAALCHAADESLSPHVIAELNKELKAIQRSRDEGVGCSCKPVKVDKLSVGKMRSELLLLSTVSVFSVLLLRSVQAS